MPEVWEILEHTFHDTIYLLPFLLLTYLLMEYLEHRISLRQEAKIQSIAQYGPLFSGLLGILPQCGFSSVASNLYAGRIITLGTLISVYLSTSDEMLVVLISSAAPPLLIVEILGLKAAVGIISGLLIDRLIRPRQPVTASHGLRNWDHCGCKNGSLFGSVLRHSLSVFFFIYAISCLLHWALHCIGENALAGFILNKPLLGELLAGLIGLIPNCASSVVLTKLYLEGGMSFAALMSGLFVSSGAGILVLFRENREHWKENLQITALLYGIGVTAGWCIMLLSGLFG